VTFGESLFTLYSFKKGKIKLLKELLTWYTAEDLTIYLLWLSATFELVCSIFGVGKFFRDERQGLKKGGEKRKGSLLVFWKERCVSHYSHFQIVPSGDPTVRRKERAKKKGVNL
jgi:hypothetical protein